MTAKQVEELESLFKLVSPEFMTVEPSRNYERGGLELVIHSPWMHGDQPVVRLILAMRDSFPRLLEERQRLLDLLRLAPCDDAACEHTDCKLYRAAVTFAEEAAP